uniref:CSON006740 protein n=1 Tax=Culicoides sonorensis TaxID=179676 RepID=A0A336LZI2_CULSO
MDFVWSYFDYWKTNVDSTSKKILPEDVQICNEHKPLLGHIETEISENQILPFAVQVEPHTLYSNLITVKNQSDKIRAIAVSLTGGPDMRFTLEYEEDMAGVKHCMFEEYEDESCDLGVEFEIDPFMQTEFYILGENKNEKAKATELKIELISDPDENEIGRKFCYMYFKVKSYKTKFLGMKFVKSVDEFWETDSKTNVDALKHRIDFLKAFSVNQIT